MKKTSFTLDFLKTIKGLKEWIDKFYFEYESAGFFYLDYVEVDVYQGEPILRIHLYSGN